jgi:hypothetical protein
MEERNNKFGPNLTFQSSFLLRRNKRFVSIIWAHVRLTQWAMPLATDILPLWGSSTWIGNTSLFGVRYSLFVDG